MAAQIPVFHHKMMPEILSNLEVNQNSQNSNRLGLYISTHSFTNSLRKYGLPIGLVSHPHRSVCALLRAATGNLGRHQRNNSVG